MSTQTIETFFTGKTLVIPSYQRDYAWKERNVDDLFDDVEEAIEMGGSHYLGTFIARRQLPWPVDVNYPGRWKRGMSGSAFRL